MSERLSDPREAELIEKTKLFVDHLVEIEKVVFEDNGTVEVTTEELFWLSYRAICAGFGFDLDFIPDNNNTLGNDVENEDWSFDQLVKEVNLDDTDFWKHRFDRPGFERLMLFWYEMGDEQKDTGFPYDEGGVSAAEFMALSPEAQKELMEQE